MQLIEIEKYFKGEFLTEPEKIKKFFLNIKAYLFDWDGVFNNGVKNENGSSSFSEIDAMGTNLLRFNYFLRNETVPVIAILSGEKNADAFGLAKREHFNTAYYKINNKTDAFHHFCSSNNLLPEEVAYFFDDVLDFSVAAICGLRILIGRDANPLLLEYAKQNKLADYITFNDGAKHAVRESIELLTGLSGVYEETIANRVRFTDNYKKYLEQRNRPNPEFYTLIDSIITKQNPE